MKKTLYIIAGPNGAGKSTAARTLLPHIWQCREFVNADEIARGLSPFNPDSVSVSAGKIMLHRIEALLQGDESFSIETTLATRSYVSLIEKAHEKGFQVSLLYLWLNSPDLSRLRVNQRVSEGGHNIPTEVIRRRYRLGISNLFRLFLPVIDEWVIYDNSQNPRICIASGVRQSMVEISDPERYAQLRELAGLTSFTQNPYGQLGGEESPLLNGLAPK